MSVIYLDHNATTPLRLQARQAMLEAMDILGNASSIHSAGRGVRKKIEDYRTTLANHFSTLPSQVIFTSGATEANNLIIKGFPGPVVVAATEHDSILKARPDAFICPVDSWGFINLEALDNLLQKLAQPALVAIMLAQNETGLIQPLTEIAKVIKSHKGFLHTDAVQAIGKLAIDWPSLPYDSLAVSGHKIGGPSGVGALIFKEGLPFTAQVQGGGQERSFRAGTENLIGLAGFAAALEDCTQDDWRPITVLRDQLENHLEKLRPDIKVFAKGHDRIPNTSNFTVPGLKSELQVMQFDLQGIALSAGSACSSGKVKASHVLKAMNVPLAEAQCALRVSLGITTTQHHIETFLTTCDRFYR